MKTFKKYSLCLVFHLCGNAYGDDVSSLQSAIQQAQSRIQAYPSAIQQITSKAATVRSQTLQVESETARFQAEADAYRKDYLEAEAKKSVLKIDIVSVLSKINDTENTVSINERISKDLEKITLDIAGIQTESAAVMSGVGINDKDIKEISEMQAAWMANAKSHIASTGPKFDLINDYDSYKTEHQNILIAWSSYPKQSALILKENRSRDHISELIAKVSGVQAMAREIAASNGAAAFDRTSKYDLNSVLLELDDAFAVLHSQLRARQILIAELQEARRKLIDSIAIAWFDLVALKLHSVNLEDAVDIASEVIRAMNDPAVYAHLRSQLTARGRVTSDFLGRLLPIYAFNEANGALKFIDDIESTIGRLDLSQAFRSEITTLLKDQRTALETYKSSSQRIIDTDPQSYLRERIRIVTTLSKRNAERLTSECKNLANVVMNARNPDLQSENDYLKFRNGCL